jgi:hypothetical protein
MSDNTEMDEEGGGGEKIENLMELQCKHEITFINNYPTV